MTAAHYSVARAKAGRWKSASIPRRFAISRGIPADLPTARTTIYVAELADGRIAYVGQTRQGTRARLLQHARRWERGRRWAYVWIVPIKDAVPPRELDRIEGRIGLALRPLETAKLPRAY